MSFYCTGKGALFSIGLCSPMIMIIIIIIVIMMMIIIIIIIIIKYFH